MVQYFRVKYDLNGDIIFCSSKKSNHKEDSYISSYSANNCLSSWIIIDTLVGFFLAIKLRLKKVRWIVFDTAHISNIPLALLAKLLGIRLSFTIHDWSAHEGSMNTATKIYNKTVTTFLADHLIFFSPVETSLPHSVLRLSGFDAVQNSVNVEKNNFLFFGRIEPYKGIRHLPKISALLNLKSPDSTITVMGAGDDPYLDEINGLANVNLVNRFVSEVDLNNAIHESIAVIMPYDAATQSGVLCKSFSCGTPVIAFSVGSIDLYLENQVSGYLIPHGDLDGFVDAMVKMKETYKEFKGYIRSNFEKKYGRESLILQYQGLIQELLWKIGDVRG